MKKKENYTIIKISKKDSKENLINYSVHVVNTGCAWFFNCQHHFLKLNPIERCFFDFLCETMNVVNNKVTIDKELKEKFIDFAQEISGKTIEINLSTLVGKLLKNNLILQTQTKSYYIVNPKFVWKGTKKQRLSFIKSLLEKTSDIKILDQFIKKPAAEKVRKTL